MPDLIDLLNAVHAEEGVGYLTADQFDRFGWAVHNSRKLIPWLRVAGYIRMGDPDGVVHRTNDRPLGLPPTWLAAEEITRLLNELNQWPELEDAANDVWGAEVAVQLTREVETAGARWPFEDRPHNVKHMRCQACDRVTLKYHPPRHEDDRIIVKCKEPDCRAVMDEDMFSFAAKLIESENDARRRRGTREALDDGGGGDGEVQQVAADDLPVDSGGQGEDVPADAGSLVEYPGSVGC